MKKSVAVTVWIIVLILLGVNYGVDYYFENHASEDTVGETNIETVEVLETAVPEIVDNTKTITVTAIGDCTLAADIYMASSYDFNAVYKKNGNDPDYFFENVWDIFFDDDLTIANFEGTLSDNGVRAIKEYAFRGNPEYLKILKEGSIEAVNLANNHTMDYGQKAFEDTKEILSDGGIAHFGMKEYAVMNINGIKVGLIGTNALNYAGHNAFANVLTKLKEEENPDLIIASFHWGEELSKIPSYLQKDLAHKAIDNGVDLVVGHHPHILQGIEKYKGKYILYSLGNFCFGGNTNPTDKDTMIFKQTFTFEDGILTEDDNAEVIPCSISSQKNVNDYKPTPLRGEDFERVRDKIIERSKNFVGIDDIKITEQ